MKDFILRQALVFWSFSGEKVPLRQLARDRETKSELAKPCGTSHARLIRQLFHGHGLKLARRRDNFFGNARIPLGLGKFAPFRQVAQGGQLGAPWFGDIARGSIPNESGFPLGFSWKRGHMKHGKA